jgi:hypothetical protein
MTRTMKLGEDRFIVRDVKGRDPDRRPQGGLGGGRCFWHVQEREPAPTQTVGPLVTAVSTGAIGGTFYMVMK